MSDNDCKKHHPYGPSRWPGLCVCPAYAPRKDGDKEFAERGTAVHEALDTGDFSKLREEDRDTARWMAHEIASLTQGLEGVDSEITVTIPEDDAIPEILWGILGTCDRTWTTEDGVRHIADFKTFGKIGISDHTPQLCGYALGLPKPPAGRWAFHILHGGSEVVETVEIDAEALAKTARKVAFAIEQGLEGARCRSHRCDNCALAGDCPESAKVVAFGALAAGRITEELVRANPAEAARLCEWMDTAAKRIEEAREIIATAAKRGVKIEDPATGIRYEVQTRQGKAVIPPLADIEDRLMKEDGLTYAEIKARATLSLTALREMVGKRRAEEYAVRGEDVLCFVRKTGAKALKG